MNPVLQSECFERAAYSIQQPAEQISRAASTMDESVRQLSQVIDRFETAVNRMIALAGMQAENDQRKAVGASMAYTEDAFIKL